MKTIWFLSTLLKSEVIKLLKITAQYSILFLFVFPSTRRQSGARSMLITSYNILYILYKSLKYIVMSFQQSHFHTTEIPFFHMLKRWHLFLQVSLTSLCILLSLCWPTWLKRLLFLWWRRTQVHQTPATDTGNTQARNAQCWSLLEVLKIYVNTKILWTEGWHQNALKNSKMLWEITSVTVLQSFLWVRWEYLDHSHIMYDNTASSWLALNKDWKHLENSYPGSVKR